MIGFTSTPRPVTFARRDALRALRPALSSGRLVQLFLKIGTLAVTRPASITVLEVAVDRLTRRRPARARLEAQRPRRQPIGGTR